MDKVLISRYQEMYAGNSLKIDAFYISKMGLMQKHTFLKVKDFFLYAIPTRLGFDSGQILIAMSERERDLLDSLKDKPQQLRMRFNSPLFGKEMGFFIKAQLSAINSDVGKGNYVLVDLKFLTTPDDFKEIVIELFLMHDRLSKEYGERMDDPTAIPNTFFKQLGLSTSTHISVPGKGRHRCLFKSLSIGRAEIYISEKLQPQLPPAGEIFSIECNWNASIFSVTAELESEVENTHQDGVKLITPKLKFSAALTDILIPMTDLLKQRRQEHKSASDNTDDPSDKAETTA